MTLFRATEYCTLPNFYRKLAQNRHAVQYRVLYSIEVLPFWIVPGRCITWEMGGSQFTMTLWMGLGQTTKNDNGNGSHSRFPGFGTIPCMGSW